ncbi:MAG: LytTR family transcriptional regulator [Flavobacteriaceae bacterium]|nr:LytTR family transcriptional regulator [Flavobacteriaceae bacterium]
MIPIVAPVLLYLRQKFGQRIIPNSPNTIIITGENKNEKLKLHKKELLYIQAVENYIEIFFVDRDKKLLSKTFRQTLSKVHEQVSFLEKCHRSYLVNINNIKEIQGNSQSAKIYFQHVEKKIPLSKTLYKSIKSRVF